VVARTGSEDGQKSGAGVVLTPDKSWCGGHRNEGGDMNESETEQAEAQKAELIGRTIELQNLIKKWTIVEDIDDFAHVTATHHPDR
jgi:hypothetical protein